MYSYNSPEEAIRSLEKAYTNEDLEAIINSKDFKTEALLILEQSTNKYDLNDEELVTEAAKLLELGMIQSLQENGYPDFSVLKSEISELQKVRDRLYVVNEKITYPDRTTYETRIFLSEYDGVWKVATIAE